MGSADTIQDVTIVGGGVSGLAAGSYLQMNGYRTHILERNAACGGVSVSWKRGEYLFDGATNWLAGCSPAVPEMHAVLRELIDFAKMRFFDFDEFIHIEMNGEVFRVYSDVDRLEAEMRRLAPDDGKEIARFTGAIRELSAAVIPFSEASDLLSGSERIAFPFKYWKAIRLYRKWSGISVEAYAERFQSPHLRSMFKMIYPNHAYFSVFSIISVLSWMHRKAAGYPMGGSSGLIETLRARYLSLGGRVSERKAVSEILVKDHTANGVLCEDHSRHESRLVVSAADMHHTVFSLLGGRYQGEKLERSFAEHPVYPSIIQVGIGVNRDLRNEPHKLLIPLDAPLQVGNETLSHLLLRICTYDPLFAPPGKTALIGQLRTHDYDYWVSLRRDDRGRYEDDKRRVLRAIIDTLETRFGRIRENVEATDVATPATYIRYTNVWKGSYQAFAPVPGSIGKQLCRTLPGLKNFYFAGQWLSPAGGLPIGIVLGRQAAQLICKREKRKFVTQKAS